MKKKPKVLLLYKRSVYDIYFKTRKIPVDDASNVTIKRRVQSFESAHNHHYQSLQFVEKILTKYGVEYVKRVRGSEKKFDDFDVIFTLGGDGTFLEASKNITTQTLLGINSNTQYSVGKLCIANKENFEDIIIKYVTKKIKTVNAYRLCVKALNQNTEYYATNDILFAHNNPAAMSRYLLKIGRTKEEHRNSGLWISSALGSSGAIKSAGGKLIPSDKKLFQYLPRELYKGFNANYQLTGGILNPNNKIEITSFVRTASLYLDGAHQKITLNYGATISISLAKKPLKLFSN